MAQPTADTRRPQPEPVDLTGIDTSYSNGEDTLQFISTAVAEAASGVTGVHHLGGTVGRSLERASRAVLGRSTAAGVNVDQEDGVTTADVDIVVAYPNPVNTVAAEVHEQVAKAASAITTGRVVVNVTVTDIFGPGDRDRVAEADAALTEASAKVKDAANRAGEAAKDGYARASAAAKDGYERASEATKKGAAQAAEVARDAAERAADAADRAADATRDGASRGVAAVQEGAARAREATADAVDAVDREVSAHRTSSGAEGDDTQVTIVTESATITVEAGADTAVKVDSDGDGSDDVIVDAERRTSEAASDSSDTDAR